MKRIAAITLSADMTGYTSLTIKTAGEGENGEEKFEGHKQVVDGLKRLKIKTIGNLSKIIGREWVAETTAK